MSELKASLQNKWYDVKLMPLWVILVRRYRQGCVSVHKIRPIWLRQKDRFFWANWAIDTVTLKESRGGGKPTLWTPFRRGSAIAARVWSLEYRG